MNRPKSDSSVVNSYIDSLEDQLHNYRAETSFVKTYIALKKQNDDLARTYGNSNISAESLNDKDDKIFDRFMKYLDKVGSLTDTIEKLEQKINPATITKIEKYINESAGSWEKIQEALDYGKA